MAVGRFLPVVILVVACMSSLCESYKPVVLMHGIESSSSDMKHLVDYIQKAHPGTKTWAVPANDGDLATTRNLWSQLSEFSRMVTNVTSSDPEYADGYHLVCHSLGALMCRSFLQVVPDHKVDTLVSLSGPHRGIYGYTDSLKHLPNYLMKDLWVLAYEGALAKMLQGVSDVEFWHDPDHESEYRKKSDYLPVINNLKGAPATNARRSIVPPTEYKDNFLRINKMVLCGSPGDEVIVPWQSSHFGFLQKDRSTEETCFDSETYQQDTFGLRSLDKAGGLYFVTAPSAHHNDWLVDPTLFKDFIEPWLT